MDLFRQLDAILQNDEETTAHQVQTQWLEMAAEDQPPLVLYGAGRLGRLVAHALQDTPFKVLAFCDADPGKQNTLVAGLPIHAPEDAARLYGETACFVVCVWRAEGAPHRFTETRNSLRALGVQRIAHFGHLARAHLPGLLPHYAIDLPYAMLHQREDILLAADLWADETSRDNYLRHTIWRFNLDFDVLPKTEAGNIYFPPDLMPPGTSEVLVDAGAFDGDTIHLAMKCWGSNIKKIHACEPDPSTVQILKANMQDIQVPIHIHECALGDKEGRLRFHGIGKLYSATGGPGGFEVPCHTLDRLLGKEHPTFIKMDIEGSELLALQGASALLRRCNPRLAICVYHRQDHPWRIPAFLKQLLPGHQFHLRYHGTDGWELVLYALPCV